MQAWDYLTIKFDGEPLEIGGANVWDLKWQPTGEEPIVVPHPQYPNQRHKLRPYYIEVAGEKHSFAAGELSNCVWCFYVPV